MRMSFTSLPDKTQAEGLGRSLVEEALAVCVQVEGPLRSFYFWEGKCEESLEYRLCIKHLASTSKALEARVHQLHPYAVPEWVSLEITEVAEKYLSWAQSPRTRLTL